MNKQPFAYLILLVIAFQSCGIINTLTKRKKDNYVNYNMLFADPEANNALRNKPNSVSTDNMVRVITINKITGDTIIEWLKPLEATNTTKKILPVKDLTKYTAEPSNVTEAALEQSHKAIIISYTDNAPMTYKVVNDTVFVTTDSNSAKKLMASLENRQFAEDIANNKKPNRIASAIKNLIKNEPTITPKPVAVTIVPEPIRETAPKTILASTNTIVGDLYFDTDLDAELITNLDSINEILKFNIMNWQTYKCKAHVKVKTAADNKAFNINLRLQQDSLTWASVSLLGIELVRAKLTKDKINVMDYTKDKFFEYNPNQLEDILDVPIAFNTLQNFIIGNPPIASSSSMLAKRNARGTAVKIVGDGSNSVFTYNADSTLKAVVIVTNKGGKSYSINGQFSDYEQSPLGKFSTRRTFTILENKKITNVEVNINKFEFDATDLLFPYKVPDKFKLGNP
jgi:hypothetical protein